MSFTSGSGADDLVQLIASQATAQFVRGLFLGIILTVGAALLAARMLLFHTPTSSQFKSRLYRHRLRHRHSSAASSSSSSTSFSTTNPVNPGNNLNGTHSFLPLPLPTLILLHRQLLVMDAKLSASSLNNNKSDLATSTPSFPTLTAHDNSITNMEGESLAFVNFLMAEILSAYRSNQHFMDWLKVDVIQAAMNKSLPAFVDQISVSDFSLGNHDQFLLFRNARLRPTRADNPPAQTVFHPHGSRTIPVSPNLTDRWRIELDIELENLTNVANRHESTTTVPNHPCDQQHQSTPATNEQPNSDPSSILRQRKLSNHDFNHQSRSRSQSPPIPSPPFESEIESELDKPYPAYIEVGIDTQLVLNWPRHSMAALPVHLILELVQFQATLAIEFQPCGTDDESEALQPQGLRPALNVSMLPGYKLDVRVSSWVGSRTKLRDVPKIADLITMAIQNHIAATLVHPAFVTIPLPCIPTPVIPMKDSKNSNK